MNVFELIDAVGCQIYATESSLKVIEDTKRICHQTLSDGTSSFKVLKDGQSMYLNLSDTVIYEDNQRFNFVPEDLNLLPSRYPFL